MTFYTSEREKERERERERKGKRGKEREREREGGERNKINIIPCVIIAWVQLDIKDQDK